MKIFVSGINTQLGYHLTQTLRQDHVLLEGYSLISGTLSQNESYMLHDSVHQTFDFSKQRDIAVKNAVESDVLILDIRYDPAPEVEFILKVLKHYPLKRPMKVIGISNYMTWSNSKTVQFAHNPHDKEVLLEYSLNKQHWKKSQLKKQHYALRVPHPMFVYNYLIEEQIMQLRNSQQLIQPVILCTGLLYGKSGFDLKEHLESAIKCTDSNVLTLKNNKLISQENKLPFLHVDQLMDEIESLVYLTEDNKSQKAKPYKVLCEEDNKSIVQLVEMMNEVCGNKSTKNAIKQDKPIDKLNLPQTTNQQRKSTQIINENSTRLATPLQALNRNSSSQSNALLIEPNTNTMIPELTLAKNRKMFSLLVNITFSNNTQLDSIKEKQHHQQKNVDDSHIVRESECENLEDSMVKVRHNQSSDEQNIKKWIKEVISEFLEYYDIEFKHFLLSEQLLHQISQGHQGSDSLTHLILNRFSLINTKTLTQQLNALIESGQIASERLATPQQDKKKQTNKNPQSKQSHKKQPYQLVFSELIKHLLVKNKDSNFVICLKNQLMSKMIALLKEPGFEELSELKFVNLTGKQRPHTPGQSFIGSDNIEKSVEISSDEFFTLFGVQNPSNQNNVLSEKIQHDENEVKKSSQKTRKVIQEPKANSEQPQELKINLLSQYLLDNLIVYLAEAKQQLKIKGKLNLGQKFEGKQNIKLFIEQLKEIKQREMQLACEEQQEER